jgi:AraC-like DNA-binding protein
MKSDLIPLINKLYVFKKHSLLLLKSGQGIFQVDFKNYNFLEGTAISLSPGQYFQLLSGSLIVTVFEFTDEHIQSLKDSRFLFKHLISVGHIDAHSDGLFDLNQSQSGDAAENAIGILSKAINEWVVLNPFCATEHDINLLFNLKEIIDTQFREPVSLTDISKQLQEKPYHIDRLIRYKLDNTLHHLTTEKILLESKRKIVFTDLSAKEIAYSTGFKDPDYFNRFFKRKTNATPLEFREKYSFDERDTFISDLLTLIDNNFREQRFANFYANKLSISPKALSNKIVQKLSTTLTQLIAQKLLQEARQLLQQQMPVNIIALNLGFKEPNHFSAFFKSSTGKTPTQFLADF